MGSTAGSPEAVLVVSSSDWLARRVHRALEPDGYAVVRAGTLKEAAAHKRERPYHLCFVDVRCREAADGFERCVRRRPSERYVLLVGVWDPAAAVALPRGFRPFGFVREPFAEQELRAWAHRAAEEARLHRGDKTLEELLYGRFREFLRESGPQSTLPLHDLVWKQVERPLIASVLEWTGGNQSRAAQVLGIHRNTLRAKIRKLGLSAGRPSGRKRS